MKAIFILFPLLFITVYVFPQESEFQPYGNPFATLYANFHKGITGSATDEAAFELVRGYLGYEYHLSEDFYAKINLDVGSPEDISPYSKLRRYAYFKNAFLRYTKSDFNIEFGLISLKQFKLQEDIWERRYLMKTLADEYRLGSSADLGVNFNYKFNEIFDADFTIMNGEGYSSLQMDDTFKYQVGSTIQFPKNLTTRLVYDFTKNEIYETTFLVFVSYDWNKKWNLAGEYVFRKNDSWKEDYNRNGFSFYGKYNLTSKYQLFARYDIVRSVVLEGDSNPWNLSSDGTALIAGIQFNPIKNVKLALNYHDWYPWAANAEGGGFIFFDLEVKM